MGAGTYVRVRVVFRGGHADWTRFDHSPRKHRASCKRGSRPRSEALPPPASPACQAVQELERFWCQSHQGSSHESSHQRPDIHQCSSDGTVRQLRRLARNVSFRLRLLQLKLSATQRVVMRGNFGRHLARDQLPIPPIRGDTRHYCESCLRRFRSSSRSRSMAAVSWGCPVGS